MNAAFLWLLAHGAAGGLEAEPPTSEPRPLDVPAVDVRGKHRLDGTAATTTLDRARLSEDPLADLPSVLDEAPSLRVSQLGGLGSFASVSVRGSSAEQVQVTLDGIPLNAADGGPVDLSLLSLGPLERVDIYRGMAPLELGGSAIGGAVALQTREVRGPSLEFEAGGGSFGTRLSRLWSAWGGRRAGVAMAVDYLGSNGDFEYTDDNGTLFGGAPDGDDASVTRENADFDQLSVLSRGHVSAGPLRIRSTNHFVYREGGLPGLGLFPTRAARLETLRNLAGASIATQELGPWRTTVTLTPWTSVSRLSLSDPRGELGLAVPEATRDQLWAIGARALVRSVFPLDEEGSQRLTLRLLGDFRHESFSPSDRGRSGVESTRDSGTVGGELGWTHDDSGFEVVVGARAELAKNDLTARDAEPGEARFADTSGVEDGSWRVAAVWRHEDGAFIRASASRSLRMPSLFELFGNTGAVLGNPTLRPESAIATDLGVGWSPDPFGTEVSPVRLAIELFGFVSFADDLIVLVQNGQAVAHAENVSSSRTAGVELGASFDSPWVGARLSGTFLDAVNTSEIAAEGDRKLPNRPRWRGFLRVEGRSRLGSTWGAFRLNTELEAMDGNFVDAANSTLLQPRFWLGVGVGATLWEELDVSVDFKNVLGAGSQDVIGYPLPGFQAMASVRWHAFGGASQVRQEGGAARKAQGAPSSDEVP